MGVLKYRDPVTREWKVAGAYSGPALSRTPTYTEEIMLAAGWTGNTYSFEAMYPRELYDISIEVAPTATPEQCKAFGAAMICGSANSNVATALGTVPTASIPILVKVVPK